MEKLYEFYSAMVQVPISFNEFSAKWQREFQQAYQVGIVLPVDQLAWIRNFANPVSDFDLGIDQGIKLALGIFAGDKHIAEKLVKPKKKKPVAKPKPAAKKKAAKKKGK